jgi:hypothetical protein
VSFESDSNVNDVSEEQSQKQEVEMVSTDDGMQTDFNAEQARNASLSICVRVESDSNVNNEREPQ